MAGRNVRSISHDRATLGEYRPGFLVDGCSLRVFLHGATLGDACCPCTIGSREIFHDMQAGESVVGVENSVRVLTAQIVFHILARQSCTTTDDGEFQFLPLKVLDHILHFQR